MAELSNKELEEYERLNAENNNKPKKPDDDKLKQNMSWIMIVLLSVMQIVMSCLSSVGGEVHFVFPTTAWGWVLLIAPKIIISVLGYLIWNTFFDKGKRDGQKTEAYKKAQAILLEIQGKSTKNEIDAVNPITWERRIKIKKGIKMILMLSLTTFLVAELIVGFTAASLISSLLSLLVSVLWGFNMMIQAEEMFSTGYLKYATVLKVQFDNRQQNKQLEENN